ncbi:MAG TPA: NAD(P)-dependent alcohol dehydrogenase [Candidatus Acidoferrales bacterium]|nr:NAD(P)-dependent alcohol dehydrogenase [Candidatus Acidoferrales bacterium]
MKAFQIVGSFGLENMKPVELPEPRPGPGQALVRMRAASLNYRDLVVIKGGYGPRQKLPLIPLSDGAGEVAAVGAGVSRVKAGDRVMGCFAPAWQEGGLTQEKLDSSLGGFVDGVLAEYVLFGADSVLPIPAHLSFEEAATLPCAALTAWNALFVADHVQPGATVVVQGTGGVSLFALQFARLAGARVIATSSSDQKLARVRELGASAGINYKTTPDWDKEVRKLTEGRGADHIVEVGGAGTFNRSLGCVRIGGMISMIGVLAGGSAEVRTTLILFRTARVQGIFVGSRAMFEDMNRAISAHGLHPVLDRTFPFEKAPEALRHLESGAHFGKVVISI